MTQPQTNPPRGRSGDPVRSLVDEFLAEKRQEVAQEKATAGRPRRKASRSTIAALVALCAAVWTAPVFMPPADAQLSPATIERSAHLTIYLASLRVREFLDEQQRLPADLGEAGVNATGIDYRRASDSTFELSTAVHGTALTYRSDQADSTFLGPDAGIRGIR